MAEDLSRQAVETALARLLKRSNPRALLLRGRGPGPLEQAVARTRHRSCSAPQAHRQWRWQVARGLVRALLINALAGVWRSAKPVRDVPRQGFTCITTATSARVAYPWNSPLRRYSSARPCCPALQGDCRHSDLDSFATHHRAAAGASENCWACTACLQPAKLPR